LPATIGAPFPFSRPTLLEGGTLIIGYHLIWTAYGCWLPNDPRGSSSHELRVDRLAELGEVHEGRKRVQPVSAEIRAFYREADDLLAHERLPLSDEEIPLVGASFGRTIRPHRYTCYACAILPDHVHLLIRRHRDRAEQMIQHLQEESREALIAAGRRPVNHPVWGGPGWKVFQNSPEDMRRIVRYIRNNLVKHRRPEQHWDFVLEYDGWLPDAPRRKG
jgi:REP element-mobilizing transposase RayT